MCELLETSGGKRVENKPLKHNSGLDNVDQYRVSPGMPRERLDHKSISWLITKQLDTYTIHMTSILKYISRYWNILVYKSSAISCTDIFQQDKPYPQKKRAL